jgi:tripartite ATP-independent transporter DctM subunit
VYFVDLLPVFMFVVLGVLLFTGFPVGFVLGGVGLGFALVGYGFGVFSPVELFNILARVYGSVAENLILTAIPMFIFMGTMLERSGIADDLLHCLQILLRRVPGGLALSVTAMGTIMAATTGIVGATVIMMTLMALPVMLARGYSKPLATGTIAAAGTLGILIPPSIMLVLIADLLVAAVGTMFVAAVLPGLVLSALYAIYIAVFAALRPDAAPPLPAGEGPNGHGELARLILKSFVPPVFLVVLVLGSIAFGWATPTEASGVGAFGAVVLAIMNGRFTIPIVKDVLYRAMLTNAMLFLIFIGAMAFAYVFRSLGGDSLVVDFVQGLKAGPWTILIVMMLIVFLLGFVLEWIEITLIVVPVFAPIIKLLDFGAHVSQADLIYWFAILLAVNMQTSFLTPPFGITLFYMKGTAPASVRIQDLYRGIVPFVVLQVIGLLIVMAYPPIALWLPKLLLN